MQLFQILDGVEHAPSVPIFTGQDGTTQVPPPAPSDLTVSNRENDSVRGRSLRISTCTACNAISASSIFCCSCCSN